VALCALFAASCAITVPQGAKFSCRSDADCDDDGLLCKEGICCAKGEAGCVASGAEARCADGVDEDRDGAVDCADPDCFNRGCRTGSASFTCDASGSCGCHTSSPAPGEGGALCADGEDNDCDGASDCADPDCLGVGSCTTTRGAEVCADALDNDADGMIDCADSDCPQGTACKRRQGNGPGKCQADGTCA
jgi:hypothetical protein